MLPLTTSATGLYERASILVIALPELQVIQFVHLYVQFQEV